MTAARSKPVFKSSDLGNIPSDWIVSTLWDLGGRTTSGSRGWAEYYSDHGDLFIRITNLGRDSVRLDLERSKYVNVPASNSEARRTRLVFGDLLISITADIGIIGYVDDRIPSPSYINQHVARVRFSGVSVSSKFIAYYLSSWVPQRLFRGSTDTGAKAGMNLATVGRLRTVVPPLAEQRRIAEVLTDADDLIDALERLIAKKQAIKQGIMQELLTGKTRLPGFEGDWTERVLREAVATPITDGPHETPKFVDSGIPFLSVNNIVDNRIQFDGLRMISQLDHARYSVKCKPRRDDILLGKAASVGKVAIVSTDLEFNIWSPLALIRVGRPNVPLFLYYQLQGRKVGQQINLLTNSSSQGNIGMVDIERIKVDLPPTNEQQAIAKILTDANEEIELLQKRLEKAKLIKQGMMQELLTGRTRLPVPEGEA